jgi:hypothetical protein
MRKLVLIFALLVVSASAYAEESRSLVLAATDPSPSSDIPRPLPPIKKSEMPKQQAAAPAQPLPSKSARALQAQRFASREARARRIAARYGIHW